MATSLTYPFKKKLYTIFSLHKHSGLLTNDGISKKNMIKKIKKNKKKTSRDLKMLPQKHFIGSQGVELLLLTYFGPFFSL